MRLWINSKKVPTENIILKIYDITHKILNVFNVNPSKLHVIATAAESESKNKII